MGTKLVPFFRLNHFFMGAAGSARRFCGLGLKAPRARPAAASGSVYTPLKDIDYFKRFSIKFNTVEWENGADFAPEYLYEIGTAA